MSKPGGGRPVLTEDTLIGGRVRLRQPRDGYRVAIDPVLLAASIEAGAGDRVLDVGCGVGAAALCLAHRVPACRVTGLEIDPDILRLASDNILLNNARDRVDAVLGDLTRPPPRLAPGTFGHVLSNPPYLEAGKVTASPYAGRREANVEGAADLERWLRFCILMARSGGSITVIHRADRLDDLLAAMHGKLGEIVVFPLWPKAAAPAARRVIVRGRKDIRTPTRLAAGLVLHDDGDGYTAAAAAVLSDAAALIL
ncbi:MAG: methyltransferase [Alphaproteobacteria bacterium]|nr:methyltransferase [Alphaproteobacteria bacterium]